jgi:hypothetical protein
MGEKQNRPFQLSFNASLKVGFLGSRITSDGGLILVRELDERLGFGELIAQHLTDCRGKNAQFCFADLLAGGPGPMRSRNSSWGAPGPDFRTWEGSAGCPTLRFFLSKGGFSQYEVGSLNPFRIRSFA